MPIFPLRMFSNFSTDSPEPWSSSATKSTRLRGADDLIQSFIESCNGTGLTAAGLVQLAELLPRLDTALIGGGGKQHARLIAALGHTIAAQVQVCERSFRSQVALLNRGPQKARRGYRIARPAALALQILPRENQFGFAGIIGWPRR